MKMCPVGAELFMRMEGQTGTTRLIVAFRNLANAPKSGQVCILLYDYIK